MRNGFSKKKYDEVDGIKRIDAEGRYLIKRHIFDNLFVSRHQLELVEAWLLNNGSLTKGLPKAGRSGATDAKEQHIWPDGERRRSVEIDAGDLSLKG